MTWHHCLLLHGVLEVIGCARAPGPGMLFYHWHCMSTACALYVTWHSRVLLHGMPEGAAAWQCTTAKWHDTACTFGAKHRCCILWSLLTSRSKFAPEAGHWRLQFRHWRP